MNPIYLLRKGSFPLWLAAQQIFRPVAKNVALSLGGAVALRGVGNDFVAMSRRPPTSHAGGSLLSASRNCER